MKKKRHFAGEDRVLRFAVLMMAALLVTGTAIVGLRMKNLRVDSSEGEKKLKELEKRDVQEIDEKIKKLEEEEEKAREERKNRTIEERFADCLILGDAVCQGIYEYECLDAGIVSAGQNLCVAAPDETGLTDMLLQAAADAPKKIFLVLGRGDIETRGEEAEDFAEAYKGMLDSLKESLPDSEIYVNSILPVSEETAGENEAYALIPEYNRKLSELCESMKLIFIDNTEFMKEEYYEEDKAHMTAAFYSDWISYMAEQTEL